MLLQYSASYWQVFCSLRYLEFMVQLPEDFDNNKYDLVNQILYYEFDENLQFNRIRAT